MDDNKQEEFECYYCYKTFSSLFMRREHISYGHKGLIEFQSSKIYHNLLKRIQKLEEEVSELKKDKMDKES
jgi:hypothetical protein